MLCDPPGERLAPEVVATIGQGLEVVGQDEIPATVVLGALCAGQERVGAVADDFHTGEPFEPVTAFAGMDGGQVGVSCDVVVPAATGGHDVGVDGDGQGVEQLVNLVGVATVADVAVELFDRAGAGGPDCDIEGVKMVEEVEMIAHRVTGPTGTSSTSTRYGSA